MFKNIFYYYNRLKFVLPKVLKKLVSLYLFLLIAAAFEMISLGSIPVFISFLIDNQSELLILNHDIKTSLKKFFSGVDLIKIFPLVIIFLFLFKNLFLLFVLYLEQKIIRDVKIYFINNIFESYINKPYAFFLGKNSSELTRNIVNESQTSTSLVANILQFSREFSISSSFFTFNFFLNPS